MNEERCLSEFRELARRMGIVIRYTGEGPSGLCTVKGDRIFFLNRNLEVREQIRAFVRDFRTLDLEGCFIVPVIRDLLGRENDEANTGWEAD